MSEFSASYHLYNRDKSVVQNALAATRHLGYVFNSVNNWTTFVVESESFMDIHPEIVSAFKEPLVHYMYSSDHGWELKIFENGKLNFHFAHYYDDGEIVHPNKKQLDYLCRLIEKQGNSSDNIKALLDTNRIDYETPPAFQLAQLLNLTHFRFVSNQYFSASEQEEDKPIIDSIIEKNVSLGAKVCIDYVKLQNALYQNKHHFISESKKVFKSFINTEFETVLYSYFNNTLVPFNEEEINLRFSEIFENESSFKLFTDYGLKIKSEKNFPINLPYYIEFIGDTNHKPGIYYPKPDHYRIDNEQTQHELDTIRKNNQELLESKIQQFFKLPTKQKEYETISAFKCFETIQMPFKDLNKVHPVYFKYNYEEWVEYFKKLMPYFFEGFTFSEKLSTKKIIRFEKKVTTDLFIGFEMHLDYWKKLVEKFSFNFEFPLNNIFAFTNEFRKNFKERKHLEKASCYSLNIGSIKHPFISNYFSLYNYCLNLLNSFYIDDNNQPVIEPAKYPIYYIQLNEELVELKYSEEFATKLKQFAFYYFAVISKTSKCYLDFLEKCLIKSMDTKKL